MRTIRLHCLGFPAGFRFDEFVPVPIEQRYHVIWDDKNPDFLFCFLRNFEAALRGDHRLYDNQCCKIALTGENVIPDLNIYDYGIGFEYMQCGGRYLRCPLSYLFNPYSIPRLCSLWREMSLNDVKKRQRFCNFIYSNYKAAKERSDFFRLLSGYKYVHSAGRFLTNSNELHEMEGKNQKSPAQKIALEIAFMKKFKFSIAFENQSYPGYTTEKITNAFMSRSVPIYWGNPRVAEDFVPGSFINAHDFDDLQALVEEVKRIDQDDDAYMEMLNTHPIAKKYRQGEYWLSKLQSFLFSILDQDPQRARRLPTYPSRKRAGLLHRIILSVKRVILGIGKG